MIQELYTLRVSYDSAINILPQPIADSDDLEAMIKDPTSNLWTIGPIADELRDLLGPMYDPLVLSMNEISEILVNLSSHLDIEGSNTVREGLGEMYWTCPIFH